MTGIKLIPKLVSQKHGGSTTPCNSEIYFYNLYTRYYTHSL